MSEDITELSRRISAAFDRMDQGLELLSRKNLLANAPITAAAAVLAPEGEGSAALLRALEAARASIEDWAERYRALQAQMGAESLAMASEITRLTGELAAARAAPIPAETADVDELTARIAEQEAELETLRAERAFDATELAAIIAALDPLVQEAPHV